ncbi:MAG: NAD(P)/FAD-dependent oxidoreductase [Spirochaetota bacterium]|nr:NAD(P)/FAD-dependent oxidoreductase [Spirochaetota bacterium]
MYDVCIIGAGVVGCAIARELSRYDLKVLICEKGEDVGVGATKANSAIVHGGYTAKHGTLKGELSIRGNRMYDRLQEELNFGLSRIGSLVLAFDDGERPALEKLLVNGEKNGVKGLRIIDRNELLEMEPETGPDAAAALYCPETAITSPYEFCIALAENAVANGAELRLHTEVAGIEKKNGHFRLKTVYGGQVLQAQGRQESPSHPVHAGPVEASFVVNAAGVYSDAVSAMIGDASFTIQPRQGQYLIFRRGYGSLVNHVIFQTPSPKGKGVLVTPTYWGNLMVGPNSEEIPDRDDLSTNHAILRAIIGTARRSIPAFDLKQVIRSFSGIRATSSCRDFILKESSMSGFIQAAGIDSPGLTSSPAIAERVVSLLEHAGLDLTLRESFLPDRPAITTPSPLRPYREIQDEVKLPEGNPERIVCRCEQVREKTIVDALRRGIPVDSTDAIKRRTRAGMGYCQGNFCGSRVRRIIARETGLAEERITVPWEGAGAQTGRISGRELRALEDTAGTTAG